MKVLLLSAIFAISFAGLGGCPLLQSYQDFNVTKFRGLWYDYLSEHGNFLVTQSECVSHIYMSETNATYGHNKLSVLTSLRDPEKNKTYTADKTLTCATESANPCLMEKQGNTFSYVFNVLETDHYGYAIV